MPTPPRATYRLQLGDGMGFGEARDLLDYLADLGVSHLYLSPILTARPGSTHGYDVADPTRVAEALGGEPGLRRLAAAARERGMGLVADIVPNHMGIGPANPLWEALLAEGRSGPAGDAFDVDWETPLPGAAGKVVLPVLGAQYGEVLHAGELSIADDEFGPRLRYHDHSFPLSAETRAALRRVTDPEGLRGEPGRAETWARLHGLIEAQHYRLVHWRAGHALVNYRRFFAIDELAAVRVEEDDVFEQTHATVVQLVADGVLEGLRVDHPDGLRDPRRYLQRLAERTGDAWLVVEKILHRDEQLADWPVAGTTGYEFANDLVGLFTDPAAAATLDAVDAEFGATGAPYDEQVHAAKRDILDADLLADLRRLARLLWRVTQRHRDVRDVDDLACTEVVARTLQSFDVYRTYVDPETGEAADGDGRRIADAVDRAQRLGPGRWAPARDVAPPELYRFLGEVLAGDAGSTPDHLEVLARFQQLSGAVMAKGVEDTAFYRYLRLVAVNEVGGDPSRLGMSVAEFHAANARRAERHPAGLLSTATHDTKRGEDLRLRIAAVSELPGRWAAAAGRWRAGNRVHEPPDPRAEYLLYQTLVGLWPVDDPARVRDYMIKAMREAGLRTAWTDPDEDFEQALVRFVDAALADSGFTDDVAAFAAGTHEIAMVTGLSQTLLRCTSPGVPDTYQGTELWDDSLVDPDNRRPVDFAARHSLLAAFEREADPAELWAARSDGRAKLWVLHRALRARRDHAAVFGPGSAYQPLEAAGRWADHLVAFARTAPDGDAAIVLAPRLPGRLMGERLDPPVGAVWGDTAVQLPKQLTGAYEDVLGLRGHAVERRLPVGDALAALPAALLVRVAGDPR